VDDNSVVVTYTGSRYVFNRGAWAHGFSLTSREARGQCGILVTEELILTLDRQLGDGRAALASYRIGLKNLEAGLRAGVYGVDKDTPIEFVFGTDQLDMLVDELQSPKECAWQAPATVGPGKMCLAAGGAALVTRQVCGLCAVPDSRDRCSDLVHVKLATMDIVDSDSPVVPVLTVALCDIGENRSKGAECGYRILANNTESWNRECWKRRVVIGGEQSVPAEDIADRLCDEIDHFGLLLRTELGSNKDPWPLKQARSIAVLFGECLDMKALMGNIAALGDLLSQFQVPKKYSVDENGHTLLGEDKKPLGQLQLLKRLVEERYPLAIPHAAMLITIRDARNGWPTHSQSRIVSVFKELSIDYPPHDFTYAWRQVMTNLHGALKGIRQAIQRGPQDSSGQAD
jgi:hypothetical protein